NNETNKIVKKVAKIDEVIELSIENNLDIEISSANRTELDKINEQKGVVKELTSIILAETKV
ncbi:2801_t:CDS:2, partial [Gigaspora margarita]